MKEEKIMYDSPEAARYVTGIEGWIDKYGKFWGKDESMARYSSCTHRLCECGNEMTKGYTKCDSCIAQIRHERYLAMPFKEWDGKDVLVLHGDDKYFFSEDDLLEYLEEQELKPEDLSLCICDENHFCPINAGYWDDVLPDEQDAPDALYKLIDEFNEKLKKLPPASYSEGKFRTAYKP